MAGASFGSENSARAETRYPGTTCHSTYSGTLSYYNEYIVDAATVSWDPLKIPNGEGFCPWFDTSSLLHQAVATLYVEFKGLNATDSTFGSKATACIERQVGGTVTLCGTTATSITSASYVALQPGRTIWNNLAYRYSYAYVAVDFPSTAGLLGIAAN